MPRKHGRASHSRRSDDVSAGGFLDVGADGGEQQQIDVTLLQSGLPQRLADGVRGEVRGQVAVAGHDAFCGTDTRYSLKSRGERGSTSVESHRPSAGANSR